MTSAPIPSGAVRASLKDIAAEFSTIADEANGIAEAEITSAKQLTEAEKQMKTAEVEKL